MASDGRGTCPTFRKGVMTFEEMNKNKKDNEEKKAGQTSFDQQLVWEEWLSSKEEVDISHHRYVLPYPMFLLDKNLLFNQCGLKSMFFRRTLILLHMSSASPGFGDDCSSKYMFLATHIFRLRNLRPFSIYNQSSHICCPNPIFVASTCCHSLSTLANLCLASLGRVQTTHESQEASVCPKNCMVSWGLVRCIDQYGISQQLSNTEENVSIKQNKFMLKNCCEDFFSQ